MIAMPIVNNPHDAVDKILARREQEDPWIMYIIIRESLNMSPGKMASQTGHAVGIMYGKYNKFQSEMNKLYTSIIQEDKIGTMEECLSDEQYKLVTLIINPMIDRFDRWEQSSFRKIVLRADDKEWNKLKEQLECFLVIDAGLTQIVAGSETCIGLWPMKKSEAPKIIKRLQVLK
jgi:peptidyl-tRNA hydrolase